ncbi:hypothetical protein BU15DRAFT_77276 [Melanogaster broomeanus]|nr:hypothetical protein BU15DRAFT_77276 [Melanogaster broomeanus]
MASGGSYEGQEGKDRIEGPEDEGLQVNRSGGKEVKNEDDEDSPSTPSIKSPSSSTSKVPDATHRTPKPATSSRTTQTPTPATKRHQQCPQRQQQRPKASNGIGRQWQLQRRQHEWLQQGQRRQPW